MSLTSQGNLGHVSWLNYKRSGNSTEICNFVNFVDYAKCNYALLQDPDYFKDFETNIIFFIVILVFILQIGRYLLSKPWKTQGQ